MGSFIARYHELTKYDPRSIQHLGSVSWDEQPEPFKEIVGTETIDLGMHMPFLDRSADFDWSKDVPLPQGPADIASIARISWFSAGINAVVQGTHPPLYLRANPSAGGLYPIELYWAVFDVPGIESGLYQFDPTRIGLVPVWRGSFRGDMEAILGGESLDGVPAVSILTGIYARSAWRYKERTYRRMLLDAGHLAGNLCLHGDAEGLGGSPTADFADQSLSELLFLDPSEEVPLLAIPLRPRDAGKRHIAKSPPPSPEAARVPEGMSFQIHAHALADLPLGFRREVPPLAIEGDADPQDVPLGGDEYAAFPGNLHRATVLRRSTRSFRRLTIPFDAFSGLVRWSFGGLALPHGPGLDPGALSTFVVTHDVEDLPTGIWKLHPSGQFLSPVRMAHLRDECAFACLGQELAREAGAVFFHTAALDRQVERAGERVYRSLCMEAGHVAQRIALAAQELGLGFSGIGGYFDEEVNALLGLPRDEAILYVTALGTP